MTLLGKQLKKSLPGKGEGPQGLCSQGLGLGAKTPGASGPMALPRCPPPFGQAVAP